MNATQISVSVQEGQVIGDQILKSIELMSPGIAVPAELAQTILDLIAQLVAKALAAYEASAGVPITPETLMALMPNAVPLTAPDA
jgi:hypothetical protein